MVLTLEQSLNNRNKVQNSVQEEIIGHSQIREHYLEFKPIGTTEFETRDYLYKPYFQEVDGIKEEILQRETPNQRYVSGILFPLGSVENDEISLETPLDKESVDETDVSK